MRNTLVFLLLACSLLGCAGTRKGETFLDVAKKKEPHASNDLARLYNQRDMARDMFSHEAPDSTDVIH